MLRFISRILCSVISGIIVIGIIIVIILTILILTILFLLGFFVVLRILRFWRPIFILNAFHQSSTRRSDMALPVVHSETLELHKSRTLNNAQPNIALA